LRISSKDIIGRDVIHLLLSAKDAARIRLRPMDRWLTASTPKGTRDSYESVWRDFTAWCERTPEVGAMEPERLVEMARSDLDTVRDLLIRYENELVGRKLAEHTINKKKMAIRSFLSANGCPLPKQRRGRKPRTTYEQRAELTQEEVANLVYSARSLRDKAIICFLAQTGQRVGVLSALKYGHIREVLGRGTSPYVITMPELFLNFKSQNINKGSVEYQFCFGEDTANLIRRMLDERKEGGEAITDESWLFRSQQNVSRKQTWTGGRAGAGRLEVHVKRLNETGKPVERRSIEHIVNAAAAAIGIQKVIVTKLGEKNLAIHPHTFRAYWKQQMRLAGIQDDELLNYVVNHELPYDGAYDRFRTILPKAYASAEPCLSLSTRPRIEEVKKEAALEAMRHFATAFGIDPMKVRIEKQRESGKEPTAEEEMGLLEVEMKKLREPRNDPQIIVKEVELEAHLKEGWQFVSTLPSGKVLIRK